MQEQKHPTKHSGNKDPKVTILLASYDRLGLLKEAVASGLAQEYTNFEVLIVDDGSNDVARNWLRGCEAQHPNLRVIFQDHKGVAAARAAGVSAASGDWVCILDSDDTFVPNAVRRLIDEMMRHSDKVIFNTGIRELRPRGVVEVHTYPKFSTANDMLWAIFLHPRVPFKHSGTLFHRKTAIELGSYNPELPCKVDIDFYLKFLRAGHCPHLVSEPLVNFRMHKNSVSRDRLLGLKTWFKLIDTYAPGAAIVRFALKILRTGSEGFKGIYMELKG